MIVYKDMTWCRGNGCTKFATCHRAFTEKQAEAAKRWWGNDNPPVMFFTNPKGLECYESVLPNASGEPPASK